MACIYVDDLLVMAKTATMANKILEEPVTKMKLKRQGDGAYFVGIKISYNKATKTETRGIRTHSWILTANPHTNSKELLARKRVFAAFHRRMAVFLALRRAFRVSTYHQ
ncbi:hypothetical protein DYB35_008254 [Aphanomyces astaci]|uniref:Reverse transcriptase Ty1/copia-type domain-containing protein n=1 Tax=Aphanomyces astaci TaxID=112090 RepID=A0A3R7ADX9_APHAT|nr:hypothetical protein DYB35_008254 [Aphanomyces astaci]